MSQALFQLPGGRASTGGWGGLRALAGLLGGLGPAVAAACPSCTARAPESPGGAGELLLALMLVPFALVGVGFWAARRAGPGAPGAERASAPVEQEHP
ncbi:hypothetical protein ACQKGO_34110 [Corallococcus interemptor]|uniref:hypothetical protein n=1 Tax=Corallococcus interemptor TaxID=2316720 RepID=UPI003D00610C